MPYFLVVVVLLGSSLLAQAATAPMLFVPPVSGAKALDNPLLEPGRLESWLDQEMTLWTFEDYAGQEKALQRTGSQSPLQVGVGLRVDLGAPALFDNMIEEEGLFVWLAALQSSGAKALRVQVMLEALKPGERLWLVAPSGPRAFGPYSASDQQPEGLWLPTTAGDTVVIVLESDAPVVPQITVPQLSHIYLPPTGVEKGGADAACSIELACETDPVIRQAATGVGRITASDSLGRTVLCTGSLLNNADTVLREPYFISAAHCFDDVPNVTSLEVIWDYLAANCDGTDVPNLDALPRSRGVAFLAMNVARDGAFMELDVVPVGIRGRAYLAWTSDAVNAGANAISIHHPLGEPQEFTRGTISRPRITSNLGMNLVETRWREGITNFGSSGSPAMLSDGGLLVYGMLSGGLEDQTCDDAVPRLDQYGSIREFFPQIESFLTGQTPTLSSGCGGGESRSSAWGTGVLAVLLVVVLASWRLRDRC